jgi:hypothetical protein
VSASRLKENRLPIDRERIPECQSPNHYPSGEYEERRKLMRRRWFPIGMVLLLLAVTAGSAAARQSIEPPRITSFYDAPRDIPHEPGSLIRSEAIQDAKRSSTASTSRVVHQPECFAS